MSLLDVLRGVMLDPAEQAVYDADPGAYLGQYGYQDVDPADLSEAFGLVADTLPADQAMAAWSGESGPESPALGDDTVDFDVGADGLGAGAPPDPVDDLDDLDDGLGTDGPDDGPDGGEADDEPTLSFGLGDEDDGVGGPGDGIADGDDLGLFGTAAPDDGAADGLDVGGDLDDVDGLDDAAFDGLGVGFDDATPDDADDGLADGGGELDDTDDLDEIDGLGPLDHGPDDLDIGSF